MSLEPYHDLPGFTLYTGDATHVLTQLPDQAADCVMTSPPYWGLRDYRIAGQYGQEDTIEGYVAHLCCVFHQLRRVLTSDGTLWLNLGDTYGGSWNNYIAPKSTTQSPQRRRRYGHHFPPQAHQRPKNLLGIPWRVALALIENGWILHNAIIWHKPNATPSSARDRLLNRYEFLFLFTRTRHYWFDLVALQRQHAQTAHRRHPTSPYPPEAGCVIGDVWTIPTHPYRGKHYAVGSLDLAQRCISAGCKPNGTVLDPFSGTATTGLAAHELHRRYIGIDINHQFHDLAIQRFAHQKNSNHTPQEKQRKETL